MATNEIAATGAIAAPREASGAYVQLGSLRARAAWWLMVLAGVGFVVAGIYTVSRGIDARNQVRTQLIQEQITTPKDASIPNVKVVDDKTALVQADIIRTHALEATGGKTYAQMERTDPNRQTALTASTLRSMLLSAALAWNTATLAIGLGAFIAVLGLLTIIALTLARPRFVQ